jgi:shikimate kinase
MPARVCLIGYRASGKTTLAPLLASALGWRWHDCDRELEARAGESIAALLARAGEPAFRQAELACLADLLAGDQPLVLATGGGVVLRPENRACLASRGGLVVYLAADAALLQQRLQRSAGGRPSLTGAGVAEEVPALLAVREPLYRACAQLVVDASRPADELVPAIVSTLQGCSAAPAARP